MKVRKSSGIAGRGGPHHLKVCAEGLWLCGVLPSEKYLRGLAIALKVEDGDDRRARPVVAVTILKRLGLITPEALPDLSPMPIKNRRGYTVGRIESGSQ